MNKRNFEKIERGGHLIVSDLTPDEKKRLYSTVGAYGLSEGTAYNRFFMKGFDPWELEGVDAIKKKFASTIENGEIAASLQGVGAGFYQALPEHSGLRMRLVGFMSEKGMIHRATIKNRFDADDWQEWERRGIRAIIDELCDGEEKETA